MNYIREINAFYDWLETNSISDSAIVLWHALMHINNKAGWVTEFAVAISTLETKTGMKKDAVIRARNRLAQVGRITFKSRNGQQSAVYSIVPFLGTSDNCVGLNDTNCDTNCDTNRELTATQTTTQTTSINKLKEIETKPETSTPPSPPDITQAEREILNQLKNIKGYPFDHQTDLNHIRDLAIEFTAVDILAEAKKYATWTLDKPLKAKSNPRLQFRNWVERAGKGFKTIDGGNSQRGGNNTERSSRNNKLLL